MTEPKNPAAVTLGSLGGKVRSTAKAEAARENGKKGGRPRCFLCRAEGARWIQAPTGAC
jgi:hypothetical protein